MSTLSVCHALSPLCWCIPIFHRCLYPLCDTTTMLFSLATCVWLCMYSHTAILLPSSGCCCMMLMEMSGCLRMSGCWLVLSERK